MRVFVLSTGRCGSTTFAKACEHLTNYSSGHESNASRKLFDDQFLYPQDHIEIDNRLSWFLGELGQRFDDSGCLYVHLTRDPLEVTASFRRRWDNEWQGGIIRAFAQGILMTGHEWDEDEKNAVCRFYIDTVNANIAEFLRGRPSLSVSLENIEQDFDSFLEAIGAEGDLGGARREWSVRHNSTTGT